MGHIAAIGLRGRSGFLPAVRDQTTRADPLCIQNREHAIPAAAQDAYPDGPGHGCVCGGVDPRHASHMRHQLDCNVASGSGDEIPCDLGTSASIRIAVSELTSQACRQRPYQFGAQSWQMVASGKASKRRSRYLGRPTWRRASVRAAVTAGTAPTAVHCPPMLKLGWRASRWSAAALASSARPSFISAAANIM